MSHILCLETSSTNCSVSLAIDRLEQPVVMDTVEDNDPSYSHGKSLHVLIDDLLNRNNLKFSDLAAIAISAGPGSYTGLRIGVSAAKGLCYALDIPLIAIDTLQAMASAFYKDYDRVVVLQDARRMEVYAGIYSNDEVIQSPVPVILNQDSFNQYYSDPKTLFVGSGVTKFAELIGGKRKAPVRKDFLPGANFMCGLAVSRFRESEFEDLAYFEPQYLKKVKVG